MDAAPSAQGDARPSDQATLPIFRALLGVQVLAAGFFGLVPYAAPEAFASLGGFAGSEPFVYRLAGAATFGYAVAALEGLRRPRWAELRIPMVATCAFNAAAVLAMILSLLDGESSWLVVFILVAAAAFTLMSGYWLLRDQGQPLASGVPLAGWFRMVLVLATAAAATFGILPLVFAEPMALLGGFDTTDLFIYRLAAAATLGYAAAGILQIGARDARAIRVQVIAAAVFNALAALEAAIYLLSGGRSPVAILILAAAAAFTAAFIWWLRSVTSQREVA